MALRPRGGTAHHQLGTRGRLSVGRVGTGFGLEVLISVPLGVAMGTSSFLGLRATVEDLVRSHMLTPEREEV
ncbi:hypothetical protein [Streptosporangium sp. NPDC049304]|uniref:hypothetical protein n=1 Tax=Streptosporangium sp. NPDC049304 TaxID=3154830 RepID=UPI00343475A8